MYKSLAVDGAAIYNTCATLNSVPPYVTKLRELGTEKIKP